MRSFSFRSGCPPNSLATNATGGSGTNKQDMVDSEGQSVLKKRSLPWERSPLTALTVRATLWCAMVMLPMANSCIAAVGADVKAGRPRLLMLLRKLVARRYCTQAQERSSLRGLTRTFGVSRTTVSCWISLHKHKASSHIVAAARGRNVIIRYLLVMKCS